MAVRARTQKKLKIKKRKKRNVFVLTKRSQNGPVINLDTDYDEFQITNFNAPIFLIKFQKRAPRKENLQPAQRIK